MIKLTRKQNDLFLALLEQAGRNVSAAALLKDVWGREDLNSNILRVTMSHLRCVLREQGSPHVIEPIPHFGYRLVLDHPIPNRAVVVP